MRELFHIPPAEFTREDPADLLAAGLGATLYLPAVRPSLAADIARCQARGVLSMICCLEDAVRDCEVAAAEHHLVAQLRRFAAVRTDLGADGDLAQGPLLFVRVRAAEQIYRIAEGLGPALGVLSGFVLPKFQRDEASLASLTAIREVAAASVHRLHAMPILESPAVAHGEDRHAALLDIRRVLDAHRDLVLAVRVGATDLSGVFGLRRPPDLTVWDLGVVAGALTDIINVFTRCDGTGFVVVGPVFEYFESRDHRGSRRPAFDGLIRETQRDLANGMLGKTVIHPDHTAAVHAVSVVAHEEYCDATAICVETDATGGVLRSVYDNKMNEVRPHRAWAGRTLRRAAVFGVAAEGIGPADLVNVCAAERKALV
ncbi:MAG: HpcH/HpaI aldolase/citrate lyase family protein [Dactylosporangium sp.]|nr:HpcH/HpaI aldolase/citrate lyase family protein [Dactylosporangium sp.]NNJ62684.1 HpcH/HpaI aldolase/citrate lyase family protein [Dactylosporangium sp.]